MNILFFGMYTKMLVIFFTILYSQYNIEKYNKTQKIKLYDIRNTLGNTGKDIDNI
jgi:hypothetical protein